ncbi:MAG: oligosaccharide flippase family protein [Sedimentisphaerales bacterium]|nr:oligosaccharide flippase family protein [Sedimentisphaerales bacterium]
MKLIKQNIVANFTGSNWQALMGLIFIPLYMKLLGIEAWGLIGIYAMLQTMFCLLDMGMSSTLNREMARLSALQGKEKEMRNLVRTLEVIYWGVAILAGITVAALSPFIAHHWVKPEQLSGKTIEQVFLLMGLAITLQMPVGFYSGGLMGLQRQVLLNAIIITTSTLRGVGAVLILWLVWPTVQAYFLWQIVISITNVFLIAMFLKRRLRFGGDKAVFQKQLLRGIWKFSAGISGITILAIILTQMDKVILSRMLSLEMFGYYVLASTAAMYLYNLVTPVFNSIYPRFTQLVSVNDQDELKRLYHESSQFISVLILPVAVVIALFSHELLLLWTQNPAAAGNAYMILSILICGTALNGIMNTPCALQFAFGWTSLSFIKNVIAVILLIPLLVYMAIRYGATGAAGVWLILNLGYVLFEIPVMHLRLLRKEKWRWYLQDVCLPLAVCIIVAGIGRLLLRGSMSQYMTLLYLIIISAFTAGITAILTPVTRTWLLMQLSKIGLVSGAR